MAKHAPLILAGGAQEVIRGSSVDEGVLQSLVDSGGHYEENLQAFMASCIPSDGVCIDVGANLGVHTLQMARLASTGRVLAYEPGGETFAFLEENLRAAKIDWVTAIPVGLYSSSGKLRFVESAHHPGGSFVLTADREAAGETIESEEHVVTISTSTLDEEVAAHGLDRIDVVKVDVEGSECEFLIGASRTLRTHRPVLIMECNPVPLLRFHNTSGLMLTEAVREIYGEVGYVGPDGVAAKIHGRHHLEMLIARHGLVDLVAGCPFVGGRRALGERKRTVKFWLLGNSVIAKTMRRLRPDFRPHPAYLTSPSCTVHLVSAPASARGGESVDVSLRIQNRGRTWLQGAESTHSIAAVIRVRDGVGSIVSEGRQLLLEPVVPQGCANVAVSVVVPRAPGRYDLEGTLLQEGHVWLHDLDADTTGRGTILVER